MIFKDCRCLLLLSCVCLTNAAAEITVEFIAYGRNSSNSSKTYVVNDVQPKNDQFIVSDGKQPLTITLGTPEAVRTEYAIREGLQSIADLESRKNSKAFEVGIQNTYGHGSFEYNNNTYYGIVGSFLDQGTTLQDFIESGKTLMNNAPALRAIGLQMLKTIHFIETCKVTHKHLTPASFAFSDPWDGTGLPPKLFFVNTSIQNIEAKAPQELVQLYIYCSEDMHVKLEVNGNQTPTEKDILETFTYILYSLQCGTLEWAKDIETELLRNLATMQWNKGQYDNAVEKKKEFLATEEEVGAVPPMTELLIRIVEYTQKGIELNEGSKSWFSKIFQGQATATSKVLEAWKKLEEPGGNDTPSTVSNALRCPLCLSR